MHLQELRSELDVYATMVAILKRIRANWIKRGCVLALVASIAVCTAIPNGGPSTGAGEDYAYVACRDKRIYVVDVTRNKVVQTSGVFETMGGPTSIDLDSQHKILYVASDMGFWQERFSPILAIDISEWPLKIIRSYELVVGPSEGPYADISSVYIIIVSPDGKKLYAAYGREGFSDGSTIVDAQTGKIIGHLDLFVDKNSLFSPGGDKLAHMWSHDTRTAEARAHITQSAAVVIYDLVQNKEISRTYPVEGKIALQPPWGKIEWPFVGWADRGVINLFDRNSGALLLSIDVNKMTGLHSPSRYATLFDDGNKIILPMVSPNENKGFVVTVDVVKGEVIQKTEVGEYPTNVIISGFLPSGKK